MIQLATGFSIGSKDLIYDKFVLTKQQMIDIDENTYPDNFFALCSEDSKLYTYDINNTPSLETGKFVLAGGTGDVDSMTETEWNTYFDTLEITATTI